MKFNAMIAWISIYIKIRTRRLERELCPQIGLKTVLIVIINFIVLGCFKGFVRFDVMCFCSPYLDKYLVGIPRFERSTEIVTFQGLFFFAFTQPKRSFFGSDRQIWWKVYPLRQQETFRTAVGHPWATQALLKSVPLWGYRRNVPKIASAAADTGQQKRSDPVPQQRPSEN